MADILGLHHMSAICGDAQKNVDFYCGVLGMRLVKVTINYDDPGAYHLYYGDGAGTPGTLLTFFPYPDGAAARGGPGSVITTSLNVSANSLDFWADRLAAHEVPVERSYDRAGGVDLLSLSDHDGIRLELIGKSLYRQFTPWEEGPVPAEHQIHGMAGITLSEESGQATGDMLQSFFGFKKLMEVSGESRFVAGDGTTVRILCQPDAPHSRGGHGGVHHVAFRTESPESQSRVRSELLARGSNVSPVMDRSYFKSIYFREPGGVLFEVATDGPGFRVDEQELGADLQLPRHLEPQRDAIFAQLPPLKLPGGTHLGKQL